MSMTCPECDEYLSRALAEVRRVNDVLRRVKASGNVRTKDAPVVLKQLAWEASQALEGRAAKTGLTPAALAEIKAKYKAKPKRKAQ